MWAAEEEEVEEEKEDEEKRIPILEIDRRHDGRRRWSGERGNMSFFFVFFVPYVVSSVTVIDRLPLRHRRSSRQKNLL